MAEDDKWYFTKKQLNNSPSRKCGVPAQKELSYRQQGAKFIQILGQRLNVRQLVINTAIVYMHRFYMFHSFTKFHRYAIAQAAFFLAAKAGEQIRQKEQVIRVAYFVLFNTHIDRKSKIYSDMIEELITNEDILVQTLGFEFDVQHPHPLVVKFFRQIKEQSKLAEMSYFMATNSLHMTTFCLQYRPAVVACMCIHFVCKWSNHKITSSKEGENWFSNVEPSVTLKLLENLTSEYLDVLDKYPSLLKKALKTGPTAGPSSSPSPTNTHNNNNYNTESSSNNINSSKNKKTVQHNNAIQMTERPQQVPATSNAARDQQMRKQGDVKPSTKTMFPPPVITVSPKKVLSLKEYSQKRQKERQERKMTEMRNEQHSSETTSSPRSPQLPKSRLQGNATGSHVSRSMGIPTQPERKKRSPKRQRDTSSEGNNRPSKIAKTSSSNHTPQVCKKPPVIITLH
ncbi:UNVERIFIED_CONTAM: hypothetical protein RMT77_006227 [Armadillidium vulgare]